MTKEELKALEDGLDGIKTKVNDKFNELQKQVDVLDMRMQKGSFTATAEPLYDAVYSMVKKADWIPNYKRSKRGGVLEFNGMDLMSTKASTVTTVTDTIQPQFTPFQYVPGRNFHVRDIIPTGQATGPVVWAPYESATTNGIARVAENAYKPQSDFTPAVTKWDIQKLATHIKFSSELLEDMPPLTSYITSRWLELLKQAEDQKLLYGSGTADIKGLTVAATAYSDPFAISGVDRWMILDAAATQVQTANFTPNYILVHPTTAMEIRQSRTSDYAFLVDPRTPMVINGCAVIPTPAMVVDDFLVGDFNRGTQLWDRRAASITFFDSSEDDALYNRVLAVIEERLALTTYHSTAFVFSSFASALARGSA